MDTVQDLAEQESVEMRQDIDSTRSSLVDKLEALEDKVMGTVQDAQDTVDDSIQIARDTVATVKRTFDIKHQVEQHPWVMVGGCFVAGLALGSLFQTVRRQSRQTPERLARDETPLSRRTPALDEHRNNGDVAAAASPPAHAAPSQPGVFDRFHEEIDKAKGLAIGYVMGLVRDSIKDSLPQQLASQIEDLVNSITTKLGAEPQHSA
jgi:ElaB/YqjD/DUF883 family membrane-anchored ribosome-binding protein